MTNKSASHFLSCSLFLYIYVFLLVLFVTRSCLRHHHIAAVSAVNTHARNFRVREKRFSTSNGITWFISSSSISSMDNKVDILLPSLQDISRGNLRFLVSIGNAGHYTPMHKTSRHPNKSRSLLLWRNNKVSTHFSQEVRNCVE